MIFMFMSMNEKELITKITKQEFIIEGITIGEILKHVSQLPIEHIQLAGCSYLEAVIFKIKVNQMINCCEIDSNNKK